MASNVTVAAVLGWCLLAPGGASAQGFESLGTRAAGMGGAFVAVADDAAAVYWNPAGLALSGTMFSLVLDTSLGEASPDAGDRAGRRSGSLLAFGTPPLGLSYYRLSATSFAPDPSSTSSGMVRLRRLTTHHAGLTLVQSLTGHKSPVNIAVGTTVRLVHGIGAAGLVDSRIDPDDLLDEAGLLPDGSGTEFDADIGVMASLHTFRLGVTARNLREPDFDDRRRGVDRGRASDARGRGVRRRARLDRVGRRRSRTLARIARRGAQRRRGRRGTPVSARVRPQRVSLQYADGSTRRPRDGLQPWRRLRRLPLVRRRRARHDGI